MIYETVEELEAAGASKHDADDFTFRYTHPSVLYGKKIKVVGLFCPICDRDHEQVLPCIEEGPIECDCGTNIYITEDFIYCDEIGKKGGKK